MKMSPFTILTSTFVVWLLASGRFNQYWKLATDAAKVDGASTGAGDSPQSSASGLLDNLNRNLKSSGITVSAGGVSVEGAKFDQ